MRLAAVLAAALAVASPAFSAESEKEEEEARERVQKAGPSDTLYAMGAILGQRVTGFHLKPAEVELVKRGFLDAVNGKKLKLEEPDLALWGLKIDAMLAQHTTPEIEAAQARGKTFADAAAREPGATRTRTGLVLVPLRPGAGQGPTRTDTVRVSYQGRLLDGTVFDASATHGGPSQFALDQVIPCWTEGMQLMKPGGKAKLICPASLAYGIAGRPPQIPGGATLVFELELLEVIKAPGK